MPGTRLVMRYWPPPSLTADRVFSINAGLAATIATPGRTPPLASLTVPAIEVSCADATDADATTTRETSSRQGFRLMTHTPLHAGGRQAPRRQPPNSRGDYGPVKPAAQSKRRRVRAISTSARGYTGWRSRSHGAAKSGNLLRSGRLNS